MSIKSIAVRTIGVVDVELSPTGIARKPVNAERCLATRRLGGQSLLSWVVRRATDAQLLDLVVAIMPAQSARQIADQIPPDVAVFVSQSASPLQRLLAAAEAYQATAVVRLRLDSPFVDPSLIDGLIQAADERPGHDYIAYCDSAGSPALSTRAGLFAEWYRVNALRKGVAENLGSIDPDALATSRPDGFASRYLRVSPRLEGENLRLRLDAPEDWERAEEIIEALGPEETDWQQISSFVRRSAQRRSAYGSR